MLHGADEKQGWATVCEWLQAMRCSSPDRRSANNSSSSIGGTGNNTSSSSSEELAKWMEAHPSALDRWGTIAAAAAGKRVAVFLDYDGTLSPIVDDPDQALMSDEMRSCVKSVASCFPTAIITGRRRDKVYQFVQLPEVYYAGSHGMDIVGPARSQEQDELHLETSGEQPHVSFQPASEFLPVMNQVFNELTEQAKHIEGAKVENNTFCITVHFRCVKQESWEVLARVVTDVVRKYERLSLVRGRKVLEVRPNIEWGKGKAVEYFLDALRLNKPLDMSFPIYIGDDRTDEDAFKVLNELGVGCPILVSAVAKPTLARFTLQCPSEVKTFLTRLVEWSQRPK